MKLSELHRQLTETMADFGDEDPDVGIRIKETFDYKVKIDGVAYMGNKSKVTIMCSLGK